MLSSCCPISLPSIIQTTRDTDCGIYTQWKRCLNVYWKGFSKCKHVTRHVPGVWNAIKSDIIIISGFKPGFQLMLGATSLFIWPSSICSSPVGLPYWLCSDSYHWQAYFVRSSLFPGGKDPSTTIFVHLFTKSLSSFRTTWPYDRSVSNWLYTNPFHQLGATYFLWQGHSIHPSDHPHFCPVYFRSCSAFWM